MNEYGYQPPEENKENKGGLRGAWRKFEEKVNEVFTGQASKTESKPESIIDGCKSLHDLFTALQKIGPIEGSSGRYSPERMSEIIDGVFSHKEKHTFNAIPSIYGLRDKVKEIYHNRFSARIAKTTSFSDLIALLNACNGLQGNSEVFSAEYLSDIISDIENAADENKVERLLGGVTSFCNLREKVRQLYKEKINAEKYEQNLQKIPHVNSFDELFALLDELGEVTSLRGETYTAEYIKQQIMKYRTGSWSSDGITSSYGLRAKVEDLYWREVTGAYDQSRSGQDQQYDQYQGYGGQAYGGQNWGRQENGGRSARQEQQSSVARRIANARTLDELYFIIDQLPFFNNEPGKNVAARMRRARFNRNDIAEIVPEADGLQAKFYELFDLAEASGEGGARPYKDESDNFSPEKKRKVMEAISKMKRDGHSNKKTYRLLSRNYHPDIHGTAFEEEFKILSNWYEKNPD